MSFSCVNSQFARKSKIIIRKRPDNNHKKDLSNIEGCNQFESKNQIFNKHGEFIILIKLENIKSISEETFKLILKDKTFFGQKNEMINSHEFLNQ